MGYAPRMAINYYGPSDDVLLNSTSQENTTSYKTYVKVKEITIRERIVSSGFRAKIEGKGDNAATISKFQVKINGVGTGNTVQIDADVDTALAAIATASGRINTAVGLANAEFDKCVAATTGPLDLANIEFDKISALLPCQIIIIKSIQEKGIRCIYRKILRQ